MRISIASYSFHGLIRAGMMDIYGYLETCKFRYGLDAADIWNGTLGPDPSAYLHRDVLAKVRAALDERAMTVANYHADQVHAWEDDPERREAHRRMALEHLRAAEYLGAKTVRIDAGGRGQVWTPEQFDYIVARFQEYCARAADNGYRLGPESHWGPELVPDNMERLARAVNNPAFGVLIHLGHWDQSTPEEGDRRLAPYAMHTHVDQKTAEQRLEPAMRTLLAAGYAGYWGVEHHSARNEYAEVERQLAAVRRALKKIQTEG